MPDDNISSNLSIQDIVIPSHHTKIRHMNTKILFLISLVFAIYFLPHQASAQNNQDWLPIYLNIVGDNKMNGVEASFQVNTCNGEDMIYIKFVNQNNYPVKIE